MCPVTHSTSTVQYSTVYHLALYFTRYCSSYCQNSLSMDYDGLWVHPYVTERLSFPATMIVRVQWVHTSIVSSQGGKILSVLSVACRKVHNRTGI